MKTFPMFLTMTDRRVVIVGGGEQAAQKCRLIRKTEAQIDVHAISLNDELQDLLDAGHINWIEGQIQAHAFRDAALVFVATGCPGLDASIHDLAKYAGAVVNVVDQPDLCDAITPSIVDRDPVVVAIGTEGNAPVLGRQIKTEVERLLEPRLGELTALVGRFRDFAAMRLSPRRRRDLWRWVFKGPARELNAKNDLEGAAILIESAIVTDRFGQRDTGAVSVIDAGAGGADLMSLRAVSRLQEADVIFYDGDVDPQVLELARRDAERVLVVGSEHDAIVAAVEAGDRVVRLRDVPDTESKVQRDECHALELAGAKVEPVPTARGVAASVIPIRRAATSA